ncbi:MAG: YkvA family protein [Candidatus Methylopumilus sp.]
MLNRLKKIAVQLKQEFEVYRLVLRHPKTPVIAKILLGLAIGYALMPFDFIPDFIPVIGQLDDLVLVPLLVYLALKMIPDAIVTECREQIKEK